MPRTKKTDAEMEAIERSMVPQNTRMTPEDVENVAGYRDSRWRDFVARDALSDEQVQAAAGRRVFGDNMSEVERAKAIATLRELQARALRDMYSIEAEKEKTARQRIKSSSDSLNALLDYKSSVISTQGGLGESRIGYYKELAQGANKTLERAAAPEYGDLTPVQQAEIDKLNPWFDTNGEVVSGDVTGLGATAAAVSQRLMDDPRAMAVMNARMTQLSGGTMSLPTLMQAELEPADRVVLSENMQKWKSEERNVYAQARDAQQTLDEVGKAVSRIGAGGGAVDKWVDQAIGEQVGYLSGGAQGPPPPSEPPPEVQKELRATPRAPTDGGATAPPRPTGAPTGAPPAPSAPPMSGPGVTTSTTTSTSSRGTTPQLSGPGMEFYNALGAQIDRLEKGGNDPAIVAERKKVMASQAFKDFATRYNLQNDPNTALRLYARQARRELIKQRDAGVSLYRGEEQAGKVQLLPQPEYAEDEAADAEFERQLQGAFRGRADTAADRTRETRSAEDERKKKEYDRKKKAWQDEQQRTAAQHEYDLRHPKGPDPAAEEARAAEMNRATPPEKPGTTADTSKTKITPVEDKPALSDEDLYGKRRGSNVYSQQVVQNADEAISGKNPVVTDTMASEAVSMPGDLFRTVMQEEYEKPIKPDDAGAAARD